MTTAQPVAAAGMIGRKVGMMRVYDGTGRTRAVTVIELGPNRVTQVKTAARDGYEAVQIGFTGNRKRVNRPERGHLRNARVDEPLTVLREFKPRAGESLEATLGATVTVEQFSPGEFVNVSGTSKGRGFAGGVKRYHFRGGPKTHGQSDRHRAPGSVGAGTTPGKVWKGQKMAGHMGAEAKTVVNLLVVLTDPARNLLFVEGSVPGAKTGIVTVTRGRRAPLRNFSPPAPLAVIEDVPPPLETESESEPEELATTQGHDQQQPGAAAEAEGAAELGGEPVLNEDQDSAEAGGQSDATGASDEDAPGGSQ